jgi:hypothetical protein
MRRAIRISAFVALLATACVGAKENYQEKAFNADSKEKFVTVATGVKEQMKPGGRYEYVDQKERDTIEKKLDEMDKLFGSNETVATMSEQNKIALFNDQEVVNSILTKRDGERVICKKEAPIGSHIPITTCHTYAQEQTAHKNNAQQMDQWGRGQCGESGHGMCGQGDGNVPMPHGK